MCYVKCVFVTPLSSTDSSVANKEQQQGAKGILWGESHVTQRECLYLYVESKQSTCLTSLLLQKLISKGKCIERWSLSVTFYSRNHQNEKIWLHISCLFTIYLLPSIVLISRDIVCQRRWRRLATEYAGVDKLLDHLQSDTKDVNQRLKIHSPWHRSNMFSNGRLCKRDNKQQKSLRTFSIFTTLRQ